MNSNNVNVTVQQPPSVIYMVQNRVLTGQFRRELCGCNCGDCCFAAICPHCKNLSTKLFTYTKRIK